MLVSNKEAPVKEAAAQAMNCLIIVFVSREEWSTATTIIETNYKDASLILISLLERSNFFGAAYTTESQNFLQGINTAKEDELYLQFHVYRKNRVLCQFL